jgi:hypothetical protein
MEDYKEEQVIDLYCLLYISRMKEEYNKEDIEYMLNLFREKNKENGISGLMLYYEGNIIQYIEGNKKDVYILYNNIKNDIRHYNITKVVDESVIKRNFVNWQMGFKELNQDELSHTKFIDFSLDKLKFDNKKINLFFEQFLITFC